MIWIVTIGEITIAAELLVIIILLLRTLEETSPQIDVANQPRAADEEAKPVRVCRNGALYASRPSGHPDLAEFLGTPGFSLHHPDGTVEEGRL